MSSQEARPEPVWLYGLAGALMTGGPLWHYLYVNHYPLRVEAVVLPLVAALLGALIGLLARKFNSFVGTLIFALLLFVFVDLQFDPHKQLPLLLIAVLCAGFAQLFRWRRATLVCITLGALYVVSLPRTREHRSVRLSAISAPVSTTAPLLVHVILDEQWGTGGLRAAGDSATATFLENFYLKRGFEVYSGAYSRYRLTRFAIADLLSLGQPFSLDSLTSSENRQWSEARMRPRSNPYFSRLRKRGYSLRVYESGYLDYCVTRGAEVASCDRTPSNSISNVGHLRGQWTSRALIAGRFFLNITSNLYVRVRHDEQLWRRAVTGGALAQLDRLLVDLDTVRPGASAYFVHLLLPHRPLEVDEACRAYWDGAHRVTYGRLRRRPMSDSLWRARLHRYAEQSRCAHRFLDEVIAAIDSTVGRDRSIIVVHGDHGSRMVKHGSATERLADMDAGQLNSVFSTLLALRRPGIPARVHPQPVPVQDFLWSTIENDYKPVRAQRWRHYVRTVPPNWVARDTLRRLGTADMPWARALP